MPEWALNGSDRTMALDGRRQTIGVMVLEGITTNETRQTIFSPGLLQEWAEAVEEAYGSEARVVFTPNKPMIAVPYPGEDPKIGIGVAPRDPAPQDGDADGD